jgi:hypothetical protein
MAGRKRPSLVGYTDKCLAGMATTAPGVIIEAILKDGGRESWTFGEIREAVRRWIESGASAFEPKKGTIFAASGQVVRRGLANLRADHSIVKRGGRYTYSAPFPHAESAFEFVREAARQAHRRWTETQQHPPPPPIDKLLGPGWQWRIAWNGKNEPGYIIAWNSEGRV